MKKLLVLLLSLALIGCSGAKKSSGSNNKKVASGEPEDTSTNQIKISESGYYYNDGIIYYGYKITNESKTQAIEYPEVTITGKDSKGKVLFTTDDTGSTILPGDTIAYASSESCNKKPKEVTFEPSVNEDEWSSVDTIEKPVKSNELIISNYHVSKDSYTTSFTGNVKNNSKYSLDDVHITVLLKKGNKTVSGYSSDVENLRAGKTKSFEVSDSELPAYDKYEIYANA